MDLSIRRIKQFIAVAEEQHFGRAALRLNMAQPPLSQSIKRLEEELGVRLFDRTRGGVVLTLAGEAFLYESRKIVSQANLAVAFAHEAASKQGSRSSLRLGFISPAGYRLLPAVLRTFREVNPGVTLQLCTHPSPVLSRMVQEGELDVAFMRPLAELVRGEDERLLVERTPHVWATSAFEPLAARTSVQLRELGEQAMIFAPAQRSPDSVSKIMAAFKVAGSVPRIVQETTSTDHAMLLVRAGLGSTLAPATVAHCQFADVRLIPVSDLPANTNLELVMVWHPRHLSAVGASLVAHTHELLRDKDRVNLTFATAMAPMLP